MKKSTIKFLLIFLFAMGIFTQAYSQIPAPINLKASVYKMMDKGPGVQLNWEYPNKILVKFSIYRKDGAVSDTGTFRRIERTSLVPYFVDVNVIKGKKYTYYVTAVGADKESEPSNKADVSVEVTEPAKGNITGTLISDATNAPIRKGKIQFLANYPTFAPYLITAVTDSLGKFSAKLVPGPYHVYAAAERFIGEYYDNAKSRDLAKEVTVTESGTVDITMSLAPYMPPVPLTIKGSVKNAQGRAIRSKVQVFRFNTVLNPKESCNIIGGNTDDLGNYSINVRSNDTVVVFASPVSLEYLPQYYKDKKTLQEADKLIITSSLTDINFVLESKPVVKNSVSGQVMDSLKQGVPSSVVAYRIFDGKSTDAKKGVLSDSLGKYSLANLNPGKYIFQAIPRPGYAPSYYRKDGKQVFERRDADTVQITETTVLTDINFTVKKIVKSKGTGSVAGVIKDSKGQGLNGALSYALDENGQFAGYAFSDGNGQYMVDGLGSGTYSLIADLFEYKETKPEYVSLTSDNVTPFVSFTMVPNSITSAPGEKTVVPEEYSLKQNYPNPFNPSTTISYSIPKSGLVTLKVYNILGKEIATLVNEEKPAGNYSVRFNAKDIPSGIYFYSLTSGKYTETRKLILLK